MQLLRLLVLFGLILTGFAAGATPAWAQDRATIFGTITDTSNAAVPGATVTLTSKSTKQTQMTVTGNDGSYVLPTVIPGTYTLKVEANGFSSVVTDDVLVQVNENRQVSPQLRVGALNTEVTVTDTPAQVDTRSSTIAEVVDAERVKDLPLNGRNPLDLQQLVAGAGGQTNLSGQQQNSLISFNGNRYNQNNYTLDNVDNEDPFFDSPSVVPNPDALDQFSIETSNYGASEGRGAGAQINAILKAGTNQFHGSAFEYVRNSIFDATPYFNAGLPKPAFKRNQYGGSIGGPIIHNKLFFFFDYQRTKMNASPNAQTLIVPDAAELAGDFSELCSRFDTTGKCSATTGAKTQLLIPGSKNFAPYNNLAPYLYQPSLKFISTFVPAANGPNNQYTYTPPNLTLESQYIGRIDTSLGAKDSLYGHLIYVDSNNSVSNVALNLPGFYANVNYTNWHIAVNEAHTFTPHLINVATFGFYDIVRLQVPHVPAQVTWGDLGAGVVRADPSAPIMYQTVVPTYFTAQSTAPLQQYRKEFQYSDNAHYTWRDHSFQFGGDVRQGYTRQAQSFQADPQLQFAASYTGNQLGDFLTGHLNQLKQQSPNEGRPHSIQPDAYIQDDWKIRNRLTLNLGVRWEPFVPYTDELGRVAQYRPGQQSTVFPKAPVGYVFPGDAGVSAATVNANWHNFSPRVGFAWDVFGDGKTSLRAGAGLYYAAFRTQQYNSESLNQPYAIALTLTKPSGGLAAPYKDIGGSPYPFVPPAAAQRANYNFTTPLSSINDFAPNLQSPRTEQWNVNVQQQFRGDIVTTLAYVGSTGEHLDMTVELNPNVANVRLHPTFSSIQRFQSGAHSTYHSLQGTLNKRMSHGVTVLASYTWSKALDNNTLENNQVANPFCLPCNRGPSDFDLRNSFVLSGIWNLPNLHGGNALIREITNGWNVNGIYLAQSGTNFTVVSGVDNSQSGVGLDLADRIGQPVTYPHAARAQQVGQYFNTSNYVVNAVGTFGNSGRNSIVGPGAQYTTFGVVKSLVRREQLRLSFRFELFNALNHPNLGNPAANVSSSATFGKITNTSGAGGSALNSFGNPRVGQAALRIDF